MEGDPTRQGRRVLRQRRPVVKEQKNMAASLLERQPLPTARRLGTACCAQAMLTDEVAKADVVITTALIPGEGWYSSGGDGRGRSAAGYS